MKPFKLTPYIPTESEEQGRVVRWARQMSLINPALRMLISVPNGSRRDAATGVKLVREGLSKGFPDLLLLWPRGNIHGLAIEMKRRIGATVRPEQQEWHERLKAAGYAVRVAYGASEAIQAIEEYLSTNKS